MTNQKHKITITYSHPDTRPPVFVAGSFTNPPWQPIELGISPKANVDNSIQQFSKTFEVDEGRYEYKLRLGPGDWWVCDESVETTLDAAGNRNNILVVQPLENGQNIEDKHADAHPSDENDRIDEIGDTEHELPPPENAHHDHKENGILNGPAATADEVADTAAALDKPQETIDTSTSPPQPKSEALQIDHGLIFSNERSELRNPLDVAVESPPASDSGSPQPDAIPLFPHECDVPSVIIPTRDSADYTAPLFPHECCSPSTPPNEPLTPTDMISPTATFATRTIPGQAASVIQVVEPFPTDRKTIYERIEDTEQHLDPDVTIEPGSPVPGSVTSDDDEERERHSISIQSEHSSVLGAIVEEGQEESDDGSSQYGEDTANTTISDISPQIGTAFDGTESTKGMMEDAKIGMDRHSVEDSSENTHLLDESTGKDKGIQDEKPSEAILERGKGFWTNQNT
ncbi:MAG: hypothetical protein M1834_000766 [Cirrosporium novae-zelandiae]|nr:MAG: hypothetical protein M1834_000766 [Cirrosporium novae-zelandiae]